MATPASITVRAEATRLRALAQGLASEAPLLAPALLSLAGVSLGRSGFSVATLPLIAICALALAASLRPPGRRGGALRAGALLLLAARIAQPAASRRPDNLAPTALRTLRLLEAVQPYGRERWRARAVLEEGGAPPFPLRLEGRGARPEWAAGQRLRAPGVLYAGDPPRNPGVAEARPSWHFSLKSALLARPDPPPARGPLRRLRERLGRSLAALPLDPALAAAARGMLLGERGELPPGVGGRHRRLGTYHLFVVSGLQFALAVLFAGWLARLLGAGPRGADLFQLAILATYFLLLPGEIAVRRAACATGLALLARLTGRERTALQGWSAALLLESLVAPDGLFSPGFLLSYLASLALILAPPPEPGEARAGGVRRALSASPRVFAWLLPVQGLFGPLPLLAPLANLWVFLWSAPLLGALWLATFSDALGCAPFAGLAAGAANFCWRALDGGLAPLDRLDWRLHAAAWPPAAALAYWLLLAALQRAGRGRAFALAALAAVGFTALRPPPAPFPARPALALLDVGQGDAVLLADGRARLLIDGGPPAAGGAAVAALRARGVDRLDACAITHQDADHAGGMAAVLDGLSCGALWIPAGARRDPGFTRVLALAAARGVPVRSLARGERLTLGAGRLEVLRPPAGPSGPPNGRGLVLRWENRDFSALLTGDAEADAERALTADGLRPADLLKIAHHGSKTSSTADFLAAAAPRLGLLSVGRRNGYGHPNPEALARLSGVELLRTDRLGGLLVTRDGESFRVTTGAGSWVPQTGRESRGSSRESLLEATRPGPATGVRLPRRDGRGDR